ncbi:MAG: hypothetical protein KDC92_10145 [Bacteroidetes bacterium]|nr:hypothetical protein [Bacteroidota bacterium]
MHLLISAYVILFGSIFYARFLNEKAYKLLTTEQKAGLIDLFSKNRLVNFIIATALCLMIFGMFYFEILPKNAIIFISGVSFLAYIIGVIRQSHQKLLEHNYPPEFLNQYRIVNIVRFGGLALSFPLLMFGFN